MANPRKYHRVALDVREQIIRRIKDDGIPVQQVAQEHGVSPKTIWGSLAKGVTHQPSSGELVKLKRENAMSSASLGSSP